MRVEHSAHLKEVNKPMDANRQSAAINVRARDQDGTTTTLVNSQYSETTESLGLSDTGMQRRVEAIAQGVLRRLGARSGICAERLDLVYLFEDDAATSNADAIRRWIERQLTNASDLRFNEQIAHIHRRLDEMFAEAQW